MAVREAWIEKRLKETAAANGTRNVSQMRYARQGVVTEEMEYVARREKIEPEVVRSEIARAGGRSSRRTSITRRWSRWGSASPSSARDQLEHRELSDDVAH